MTSGAGRVVLVTGASTGIGRASVFELDARGFRVLAGVRRTEDAEQIRADAPGVTPLILDVTRDDDIAAAVERVREAVKPTGLFGLVNNAGIVVVGPLEFLPSDALRAQFAVNVFGPLSLTQACLPLLRQARGRVINVSSVNGRLVSPFSGAYAASKFALEAVSDALRQELKPSGVDVVVVQPGAFRTAIWDRSRARALDLAAQLPAAAREYYGGVLRRLPRVRAPRHAGPPERVARVIARALLTRRPRTRYRVGWDARAGVLLSRLLPGRALDALMRARGRRSS